LINETRDDAVERDTVEEVKARQHHEVVDRVRCALRVERNRECALRGLDGGGVRLRGIDAHRRCLGEGRRSGGRAVGGRARRVAGQGQAGRRDRDSGRDRARARTRTARNRLLVAAAPQGDDEDHGHDGYDDQSEVPDGSPPLAPSLFGHCLCDAHLAPLALSLSFGGRHEREKLLPAAP